MVTRSDAFSRSPESMRQHRSMSSRGQAISVSSGHPTVDDAHTRVLEAEAVRRAPKREQSAIWLNGADEAFEKLADVLLDGHLLRGGEELDDEVKETL